MPFFTLEYERADLRARLAALAVEVKLLRWAHALRRRRGVLWWKDKDGDVEGPGDTDDGPSRVWGQVQYAQSGDLPRDHNGPPGGPLPEEILPVEKPVGPGKVAPALRDAASLSPEIGIVGVLLVAPWMAAYEATIRSYNDPAKPLAELQADVGEPKAGYDDHHVVEKASAKEDGFSNEMIDSRDNLVKIPRMKHWDINRYYTTAQEELGGVSPREFLRGKTWQERYDFGINTLSRFGVLNP